MARLLIVDNDERIVELSAWFLRRLGHAVDTANSFAAARIQLGKTWPDLMLADLDLGYERGQEELPKLANEGSLPPTLVVSGFLDADLDSRLRRIPGVLGTVAKPVDLKQLEGLIRHHLEHGERIPAPAPKADLAGVQALESLGQEDEDADGWVEIAPLAPGIDPAPPARQVQWGDSKPVASAPDEGAPGPSHRPSVADSPLASQRRVPGQSGEMDRPAHGQLRESGPSAAGVPDPRTRL